MIDLEEKARHIRELILTALAEAGSGHTGGSLDLADIFTVLYFNHMRHDPKHPDWEGRDKVVLSIGHTAPVLYATLAAAGYFPETEMLTLRKLGSRLQGHPSYEFRLPGLETCSGSLGQGLGVALGMALAAKMDGKPNRVFCIMGDGEQQEGSVWESVMAAAHHKLGNLCAIIDRNRLQIDGGTEKVMAIDPLRDKWAAFGWHTIEIDGHDMSQIKMALEMADKEKDKPTVIIADTIMGKGVKSIENNNQWHGKVPSKEQVKEFLHDSVKAWLDDELVFDTVLKHDVTKGIFSSATIDDANGELIVKVVNTSDMATTARLNLKNFVPGAARVVRLAANDGMEENTLSAPTTIHPVEQLLSPEEGSVLLDVPPYSLNIVRIKQ